VEIWLSRYGVGSVGIGAHAVITEPAPQ